MSNNKSIVIRECTEFGLDMVRGLPRAYFCAQNNIPHQCVVKPQLKNMYELVSDNVETSKDVSIYNPEEMYKFEGPSWIQSAWTPPPLKKMFEGHVQTEKPTVVINNKCTNDWNYKSAMEAVKKYNINIDMEQIKETMDGQACTNYYSIPMLSKLIEKLSDKYQIIYISPVFNKSYFKDNSPETQMDDFGFLQKNYPDVYTIKDFLNNETTTDDYNIAQFMLEASAEKHLSLIGGNCKISSYFGGDVIIYRWEGWRKHHPKGNRDIFKTGSWLRHLSGANIVGLESYDDILDYIDKNWI